VAILEKKHADAFVVTAETASHARLLVGLADWNAFAVPDAPPELAHAPQPLATSPAQANQYFSQTWKRFDDSDDTLFDDDELKAMTRDTFEHPRVVAGQAWVSSSVGGGPYFLRKLMLAALFSPESRSVFLVENFDQRPDKKFDDKLFARASEDKLIRALQTLGIKQVELPARAVFMFPRLTKTGAWLPARLPLPNDIFR
jgi:hypothetical protein